MRRSLLFLSSLIVFSGATALGPAKIANEGAITGGRLRAHLELIADDLLEGRDTPSRGLDLAALYISTQLKLWGVKPMGDNGTYFQSYSLARTAIDAQKTSVSFEGKSWEYGKDFYALNSGGSGALTGPLAFVGAGYVVPRLKIDPYKQVDVKGKVVVCLGNPPKDITQQERFGQEGCLAPAEAARTNGAKGIIYVPNKTTLEFWESRADRSKTPGQTQIRGAKQMAEALPTVYIAPDCVKELFKGEKVEGDQILASSADGNDLPAFTMTGTKRISGNVQVTNAGKGTQNVVGLIEGTDPKLKKEYVICSAHYDHVGMSTATGEGDHIYNGADDDGSGTVAILEMAHAFATGPKPKRSILFVWHSGEEKGLWGSAFMSDNPVVPITSIVADLNIDMIGRSRPAGDNKPANKMLTGPDEIYVVGSSKLSTDLGNLVKQGNAAQYNLKLNYHYDEPNDPENIYQRSDHYNYARKGIPICFYFDGVHEDYHRLSDSVEKIDFQKMEKVTRTVYVTAWMVANRATRPKVDKSGD